MSYQNYYQPVIPAQMQAELAVYQQKQIISASVKISEAEEQRRVTEYIGQLYRQTFLLERPCFP